MRFLVLLLVAQLVMTAWTARTSGATARPAPRRPGIAVLDAPSNLGLRPLRPGHIPGVWRLSTALRSHGLMQLPNMDDAGPVPAPPYDADAEPAYGFRQGKALRTYSLHLAERLGGVLDRGRFTLLLGGDCSILAGAGLALKKRGRYGLVFIDGHADYSYPRHPERFAEHGFTAAGLDLGLVTGHGPSELTDIGGHGPYFDETDVVAFGIRDEGDPESYDLRDWQGSPMLKLPLEVLHRDGPAHAAMEARLHLENREVDGIWIHLDADVIDPRFMPAVDSPEDAGGMTFDELETALSVLLRSERVIGLDLTIFDPDLDPDGSLARRWVELLGRTLPQPLQTGRRG